MSGPDENARLEIGHVLFVDIVGYSKLLIEEQKERLHQLTGIVLATSQVREATDEHLVRLPTGDGMALVFRRDAEEPADKDWALSKTPTWLIWAMRRNGGAGRKKRAALLNELSRR